tara:strand:+ start:137 stop:604 length:468 start_codon:yes stop_codon:yes gene_type:complete
MFKSLRNTEEKKINNSGRSHVGETMQLEGDLRTSGAIDVAGLVNGNIFVSEMSVTETGSIRGTIEAGSIEVNGHVEGKITADVVIIGKSAVIKGDIFFKSSLKTEEGADIEGYIKRTNNGKSNTEEDIAIEEIVEREETFKKPKPIHVVQQKKAV